jgi:hypothetical protein
VNGRGVWQPHSDCSFQSSNLQNELQHDPQRERQQPPPVRLEQQPEPLTAVRATIVNNSNFRMTHLTGKTGIASPLCCG